MALQTRNLSEEQVREANITMLIPRDQREKDGALDVPTNEEIRDHDEVIAKREIAKTVHIETDSGQVYHQDLDKLPYLLGVDMADYIQTHMLGSTVKVYAMQSRMIKAVEAGDDSGEETLNVTSSSRHYAHLTEMLLAKRGDILNELTFPQMIGVGRILKDYLEDVMKAPNAQVDLTKK